MRSPARFFFALLFFTALILVSRQRIEPKFPWRYSTLTDLVVTENFAGDLGALLLGAHRLAADIAYIQFLQYYGVPEDEPEHEANTPHVHDEYGGGVYPRLKEVATRYLRLDPFFNGAILESAGALAFNVKRTTEALDYLREAIERDSTFYRYHLYVAAVLYKNTGEDEKLIEKLQQAMAFSDCPPLLQGVLGNLLKKYGRYAEAGRVYLHTLTTAAAETDRKIARDRLIGLLNEHPDLMKTLGPSLPR